MFGPLHFGTSARQPLSRHSRCSSPSADSSMKSQAPILAAMLPLPPTSAPSISSYPVYGPANPYDPETERGQMFIERCDSGLYLTAVDKWIQANMALWHQGNPRLALADLLKLDMMECKIEVLFSPVRALSRILCTSTHSCQQDILPPNIRRDQFLDNSAHHSLVLTTTLRLR